MMRPALSTAAAGLLRALLARADVERDRILLTDFRSVDWQSLTFIGERHEIRLRLYPDDASHVIARLTSDIDVVEWHIPGQIVADIGLLQPPTTLDDGSVHVVIEALTIVE